MASVTDRGDVVHGRYVVRTWGVAAVYKRRSGGAPAPQPFSLRRLHHGAIVRTSQGLLGFVARRHVSLLASRHVLSQRFEMLLKIASDA